MKYNIKNYLIQEGVLDAVKNNWGKGLAVLGAGYAAKAGVFGDKAKAHTDDFLKKVGDFSDNAVDKLKNEYGKDVNGDGTKELPGMTKNDNFSPNSGPITDLMDNKNQSSAPGITKNDNFSPNSGPITDLLNNKNQTSESINDLMSNFGA